ncbi:MAG TPA: GNAT family N-acetyltransferase [Candidatus Saccharimonadales bacterium]|nr:GNAT family N-acetyltransferase [Candidatus Saccharimonadales bacterium]
MNKGIKSGQIIEFEKDDRIGPFFAKNWGNNFIVSKGKTVYGKDLPGFMTLKDNSIIGLLTYHLENNFCEIVTLDSLMPSVGIGSALIQKMIDKAKNKKYSRLWLITTNDNIDAMKFYQRRGFVIKAVYPNAIEESRKLKQNIPKIGDYGIPIRDEIELEYPLVS